MAVTVSALVQSTTGVTAQALRQAASASLLHTSGAQPRAGVLPSVGGGLAVTPGSGLSVNVASGGIVIPAPGSAQGGYVVYNDAILNIGLAASSSQYPRIDLIIARVADPYYSAGDDGLPAIKAITGTASSSPTVPPIPSTEGAYVVLKQVTVPANATAVTTGNIADYATPVTTTAAAGGVLRLATTAARDTALSSGAVYPGMSVWVDAVQERHDLMLDPATGANRWLRSKAWTTFTPTVARSALTGYNNNALTWSTCKGWYYIADSVVHGGLTLIPGGVSDSNDGGSALRFTPPVTPASALSYGNIDTGDWRGDNLMTLAYFSDPAAHSYSTNTFTGTVTWTSGAMYFQNDSVGTAFMATRNLNWFNYLVDVGANIPLVTCTFSYPVD